MKTAELRQLQEKVAGKVLVKDDFDFSKVNLVAGFDVATTGKNLVCYGVIINKKFEVVESKSTVSKEKFPYIPTMLMFREGPPIFDTFTQFENRPELIMVDGNGILHPSKSGLASYVGVSLNIPTIGVAKKLLCGEVHQGKVYVDDEVRGVVLYTKEGSNPIFVSPGHRVSVDTAGEVVKFFLQQKFKLPEPLRLAHKFATKAKRDLP
ncbi:MAG: endonuclease V [archaeon]